MQSKLGDPFDTAWLRVKDDDPSASIVTDYNALGGVDIADQYRERL